MARTRIYTDNEGNKLNGCYYSTDPDIDDYSFYDIESEYFTLDKTVDKDHCYIQYAYEHCNEAIEAARDIEVSLFITVFKNGKMLENVYESCLQRI